MGSLKQLLDGMTEENATNFTPTSMKVRCGNCGTVYSAPGYDVDITCPKCITITQTNNDLMVGNNAMQRDKIKERKKIDQTISTIPYVDHFSRTIDER